MVYLTFMTATGKFIAVNPRKQRSYFWRVQDGLIAEGRLEERHFSYDRYRRKRGCTESITANISIAGSARKDLDRIKDGLFHRLDNHLKKLAAQPIKPKTKPLYIKWFIGNLRIADLKEFSVVYTFDKRTKQLHILLSRVEWGKAEKFLRASLHANRKANS